MGIKCFQPKRDGPEPSRKTFWSKMGSAAYLAAMLLVCVVTGCKLWEQTEATKKFSVSLELDFVGEILITVALTVLCCVLCLMYTTKCCRKRDYKEPSRGTTLLRHPGDAPARRRESSQGLRT